MNEELVILHKKRIQLAQYIVKENLMEEKHYMKYLELQDVNFKIIQIEPKYDYSNITEDQPTIKEDL